MKKTSFCLLLAVVMAISVLLTGCIENAPVPPASTPSTTQPTASTQDSAPVEIPDEQTTPTTRDPEGPEPVIPPATPEEPPEFGDEFRGEINEKSYTNSYIGIACTFSDDWQIYSNELGAASSGHAQFYDIQAENTKNNATMHVTLISLNELEQAAYGDATDQEVVDIVLAGSDLYAESYAQAGITVQSMEKEKFTYLGQDRWCVFTTGDMMGANYYIVQIFQYNLGPYGATITAAGFTVEDVQSALSLFFPLNP